MTIREIKVGDMVWGNLRNGSEYAWVTDISPLDKVVQVYRGKIYMEHSDLEVRYADGKTERKKFSDVNRVEIRVLDINRMDKWQVNALLGDTPFKVKMNNGYFGSYSVIRHKGKKAVVFCDDRDAIVKLVTAFYDDILCIDWSGDYRWNTDKPCIVKEDGLYNILEKHSNHLLCGEWLKEIKPHWKSDSTLGYYLEGVNHEGKEVIITDNGTIRLANLSTPKNINNILAAAKLLTTKQEIIDCWISKGLPCAHIRGLEYKGARCGLISKEEALRYIETHCSFSGSFNSAEWRILDGAVTLLFRDYCDSDYD